MERLLGHLTDAFQHTNSSLITQTFRQSLQRLVDCPAITAQHFVGAANQLSGTLAQIIGTHQKVLEHGTTLTGANRAGRRNLINRHRGRRAQVIGRYWQPIFCFQHITRGHSFIVEIFQWNTDTTNELIRKNKRINLEFIFETIIKACPLHTWTRVGDVVGKISHGMGALLLRSCFERLP